MAEKTPMTPDDPEQSRRFIDMAREVEAADDDARAARTFDEMTKPKPVIPSAPPSRRSEPPRSS